MGYASLDSGLVTYDSSLDAKAQRVLECQKTRSDPEAFFGEAMRLLGEPLIDGYNASKQETELG